MRLRVISFNIVAALAAGLGLVTPTLAQTAGEILTVEQLLKSGWQVVGFSGAGGNRMGLVLFRHATETYLVQCLTGYDDTVVVSCYELH